jgi:hypothetical protein
VALATTWLLVTMVPARIHDHAGAQRILHALARPAEAAALAEEAAEERVVADCRFALGHQGFA